MNTNSAPSRLRDDLLSRVFRYHRHIYLASIWGLMDNSGKEPFDLIVQFKPPIYEHTDRCDEFEMICESDYVGESDSTVTECMSDEDEEND